MNQKNIEQYYLQYLNILDQSKTPNAAGNILTYTSGTGSLTYTYLANRLTGVSGSKTQRFDYDPYGHITGDGTRNYTVDDAGSLREVDQGATARYDYDGKNP